MRKVIVDEWMSLDGVVQAPGRADEDEDDTSSRSGMPVMRYVTFGHSVLRW